MYELKSQNVLKHQNLTLNIERFSLENLKKNLKMNIVKLNEKILEIDISGVDVSFVNALRRIILSDIPTVAIEKVHVLNNTSIMQDEIIAHRLGLIPLNVDPSMFNQVDFSVENYENSNDIEHIVFELNVKCIRKADGTTENDTIHSGMLKWIPMANQSEYFHSNPPCPLFNDIPIVKLVPGQVVNMRMYCQKSNGRDHAKFSPVSNVFYRLMPDIKLKKPVYGELAKRLINYFSPGVIGLVPHRKYEIEATVLNPRLDSNSRNVLHDEDLKDLVVLSRISDCYIFTVESLGAVKPERLFMEAIEILKQKKNLYKLDL